MVKSSPRTFDDVVVFVVSGVAAVDVLVVINVEKGVCCSSERKCTSCCCSCNVVVIVLLMLLVRKKLSLTSVRMKTMKI